MTDRITHHGIAYDQTGRRPYKYVLAERYEHPEPILLRPAEPVDHPFMTLTTEGALTISSQYAWDGASGPVCDTPNVMRAALVHDALYQMLREKLLPWDGGRNRQEADEVFRQICLADGTSSAKAWVLYVGLRIFGAPATWRFLN